MIRTLLIITAFGLLACNSSPKNTENKAEEITSPDVNTILVTDTTKAAAWLIDAVKEHFENNDPTMETMSTKTYYQYKTEATNVDMGINGSLDRLAFEQKWKDQFDTKYAGIQTGFLISAQDNGKVIVNSFDFLKEENNKLWFNVILEDVDFKTKFRREIAIVKEDNSFKVADVKESIE